MKKIALWIGGVLVVLIIVVVAVPFFIPAETYKREITRLVEDATGRKFEIKGSASLSIFPSLEIEAKQVTLGNAPGASAPNMAELQGLRIAVQLWPLLSGNIAIDPFVLD